MNDPTQLANAKNPIRTSLANALTDLQSVALIAARQFAIPLLLLGAGLMLVQPCAATPFQWEFTGSLNNARSGHTATLLADGKVLVAAGYNFGSGSPASSEPYDLGIVAATKVQGHGSIDNQGNALVRRVSQSNLAQGNINGGGGDGVFITGGTYAYVVEGSGTTNAFQIFNISDPKAPVLISQSNLANGGNGVSTDDIWVKHGFAYIVEGGGTVSALQVFDVTNPAAPVLVGHANLTNNAGDRLFVRGKYAYIIEGGSYTNSFEIFNISNPAAPVRVSQSNLTAFDQASIYVRGNYAYIAIGGSGSKGFDIFDVSNPAAPILKSATDLNYGVPDDGIFVSGNYAYIAEGAGTTNAFQIFDVSNPSSPVLAGQADLANAGSIDTGGGDAIWVRDGFAYIVEGAGTTNAFEIFDVSNPATPSRVSQSPLANSDQPDDIFVSGKCAYIVEGGGTTNAFEIFDISRFLPPDNL